MHWVVNCNEESFIKLKCTRMLLHNLPNDIKKLREHRGHFLVLPTNMTASVAELVTKTKPVFFNHCLKAVDSAIVRIKNERCNRWRKPNVVSVLNKKKYNTYSRSEKCGPSHQSNEWPHWYPCELHWQRKRLFPWLPWRDEASHFLRYQWETNSLMEYAVHKLKIQKVNSKIVIDNQNTNHQLIFANFLS